MSYKGSDLDLQTPYASGSEDAGAQASWLFRPYLVRPRATGVVFMHPLEGSFSEALGDTLDSARGRYSKELP